MEYCCACVMVVSTFLVTAVAQHLGLSPQEQGLRPAAQLEDAPPPDLVESPNRMHDPMGPVELNATALRVKLGRNFDPAYMSPSKPTETKEQNGSPLFLYKRNRQGRLVPVGDMPKHLKNMDFKYLWLPDGSKLRTRISPKLKKKLQQFLWAFTACPVEYQWKDLGLRFWPRWLKEGRCQTGRSSCSVPPGMKCQPSSILHKTLLRWHCKTFPLDNRALQPPQQRHCQWIKVEYPIVTQCACECPTGNS